MGMPVLILEQYSLFSPIQNLVSHGFVAGIIESFKAQGLITTTPVVLNFGSLYSRPKKLNTCHYRLRSLASKACVRTNSRRFWFLQLPATTSYYCWNLRLILMPASCWYMGDLSPEWRVAYQEPSAMSLASKAWSNKCLAIHYKFSFFFVFNLCFLSFIFLTIFMF